MSKLFVLPNIDEFLEGYEIGEKVVVVSIIGKSTLNANGFKVKSIRRIFSSNKNRNSECTIEGFYDEENQMIYLHVHTLLDSDAFLEHYDAISRRCKEIHDNDDFLVVYNEVKSRFARTLLYAFYVSHIVILSHIGHTFDLNYIQYFKAVDALRHKLLEDIQKELEDIEGLSKEWVKAGRMCTPRLIFYFEKCPKNIMNIKKLEHNIEDQIYQILKKTRIISNNSTSTLFTIPPNDEYAYVNNDSESEASVTDTPSLALAVRSLIAGCEPGVGGVRVSVPFCDSSARRSFRRFMDTHIKQAHSDRGFADLVMVGGHGSRHGHVHGHGNPVPQPHFELPTLGHWASVAKAIYVLCVNTEPVNSLCTETHFSQQRCLKALPIAFSKYQEGLPSHYGESIHKARLAHALAVFGAQARGPMYAQYENRLIADCAAYWAAGVRQACESPSLSGRGCELPRHASDVPHCSGSRRVAACDCGRMQATRDDPYTAKQANYTFYHQLSKECTCFSLERFHFPIFQPSGPEYGPADLSQYQISTEPAQSSLSKQNQKQPQRKQEDQQNNTSDNVKDEIEIISHKYRDKVAAQDGFFGGKMILSATDSDVDSVDKVKGSVSKKWISTMEYLAGMCTATSPSHFLPTFSSWSLVCLGPSSVYSHNQGLPDAQQPGFLPTTNYLLPWDKQVQYKQQQRPHQHLQQQLLGGDEITTTILLTCGRKKVVKGGGSAGLSGSGGGGGGRSHFTVKVFIGVEYECPKGHRFMLAGPDRILRAVPGILVTDTAHRLVDSDMPLFHPCPCRPSVVPTPANSTAQMTSQPTPQPLMAQLMRLHVVTPKAPVTVTLSPKIQPAAGAPIFLPPGPTELRLTQSTYWVLRLPYMYVDEREQPVVGDPTNGRMLKDAFAVRKDYT